MAQEEGEATNLGSASQTALGDFIEPDASTSTRRWWSRDGSALAAALPAHMPMTGESRASIVRRRWRALAAVVIAPLAIAAALVAAASYAAAIDDIDARQRQTAGSLADRSELWLIGAAQRLLAATRDAGRSGGSDDCAAAASGAIRDGEGFKAVRLEASTGACDAGEGGLAALMPSIDAELAGRPRADLMPGTSVAIDAYRAKDAVAIAIQVASTDGSAKATALIDPDSAAQAIARDAPPGEIVALMSGDGKPLAVRGADIADTSWLPSDAVSAAASYQAATAPSRSGAVSNYATQPVPGSNLYVLARFSDQPHRVAQLRFLVLALASPLVAALCLAFSNATRAELLGGVGAILTAMLARNRTKAPELVPDDVEMPVQLREFVAAYNEMARESASREQSLHASLAENQFLLRELNHRVKSSLQIIQSYLSLTRRVDRDSGRQTNAAAIEARVQVLSTAYRKALSEGRMRDVRIRQFAEEIVAFLSQLFERSDLTLELKANVAAALVIDRAIPFGLAIVESMIAGMAADGARVVVLRIDELEDLRVEMRVWTDGALRRGEPDVKLLAGLALQLAAIVDRPEPGTIVHWRFQGRPPPILGPQGQTPSA